MKARDVFQSLVSDSIRDILEKEETKQRPADLIPSVLTIRNLYNFNPGNFHYIQKTFDLTKKMGSNLISLTINLALLKVFPPGNKLRS